MMSYSYRKALSTELNHVFIDGGISFLFYFGVCKIQLKKIWGQYVSCEKNRKEFAKEKPPSFKLLEEKLRIISHLKEFYTTRNFLFSKKRNK